MFLYLIGIFLNSSPPLLMIPHLDQWLQELLTLELQEARDQNELFEFRIHELEQIKVKLKRSRKNSIQYSKTTFPEFNL